MSQRRRRLYVENEFAQIPRPGGPGYRSRARHFADPYSSYQRGTNEHHNGRLRRYLPKGTDFTHITETELQDIITQINNQPRKCLDWLTPNEVFQEHLQSEQTDQCCTSE